MKLYWIFFVCFCLAHLAACYFRRERERKLSKVLLMPLLMLGCYLSGGRNLLVYLGLGLGWLGDVFLLSERRRYFVAGAVFFALGHFAYIGAALRLFLANGGIREGYAPLLPIYAFVLLTLLALARYKFSARLGRLLSYLGALYFSVLFAGLLASYLSGRYMLMAGFAVFTLSDSLIAISRFLIKIERSHFYVMLSYILAQTLIALSFV